MSTLPPGQLNPFPPQVPLFKSTQYFANVLELADSQNSRTTSMPSGSIARVRIPVFSGRRFLTTFRRARTIRPRRLSPRPKSKVILMELCRMRMATRPSLFSCSFN